MTHMLMPDRGPYIDYDAATQDVAIRKIVAILQANQRAPAPSRHNAPHELEIVAHRVAARRQIVGALSTYRAAVTELVLAGNLTIDQGEELSRIVDRIVEDET